MGQRANYIIVEKNDYRIFYSHYTANYTPNLIFWGAKDSLEFIESLDECDKDVGWYSEIYSEGGALLDFDNKLLLLFASASDVAVDLPMRKIYLELLNNVWEDWQIFWTHRGIEDMAEYVGKDVTKLLDNRNIGRGDAKISELNSREWADIFFSVCWEDKGLLLYPLLDYIIDYLPFGPGILDKLEKIKGYGFLPFVDWSDEFPSGGCHIDMAQHKLWFWHAEEIPAIEDRIIKKWSDWDVEWLKDDYERHLGLVSKTISLPERSPKEIIDKIVDFLIGDDEEWNLEAAERSRRAKILDQAVNLYYL